MGDPGVSLSLKDVEMDTGFQLVSRTKGRQFCYALLFDIFILYLPC